MNFPRFLRVRTPKTALSVSWRRLATSSKDVMATYHSLGIVGKVAGKSSNNQWAFRQLWKQCGVELHQRDLSRVFMTVGVADTSWPHQFFSTVTFESQRSTEEERSWSWASLAATGHLFEDVMATYHPPGMLWCTCYL